MTIVYASGIARQENWSNCCVHIPARSPESPGVPTEHGWPARATTRSCASGISPRGPAAGWDMDTRAWLALSVGVRMEHAWRLVATTIPCVSGKQRMAPSCKHSRDIAKMWQASCGVLMGESWQVVVVEAARGNYFSGMPGVENCYVPWGDIPVMSSPLRGVPKAISWSVPASTGHCAGGMSKGECVCTFDKVIKDGLIQ